MSVRDVHQFSDTIPEFAGWFAQTVPVRITSHDDLNDLDNDGHTQYHTDARGDTRYTQRGLNLGDLTDAEQARKNLGVGDDLLSGNLIFSHAHPTFYDECHDRDLDHWQILTSGSGSNSLQLIINKTWMQTVQTSGVWVSSTGSGDIAGDAAMTRGINRGWFLEPAIRFFFRVGCSHNSLTENRWGWADDPALGAQPTSGIYCEVDTVAFGNNNIRLVTANAGTRTKIDTGVAFNRRVWYDVDFQGVGQGVSLFIDGNHVAHSTTNLPAGAGQDAKPFLQTEWTGTGSTNREIFCDWLGFAVPKARPTYGNIQ